MGTPFWKETRATLFLALPIVFGQLLQSSLNVIDTVMVGQVSVAAVAACSFATALFMVPLIFGFGVLGALSVFIARAAARHDREETVHLLRRGLVLSLGLALILVVAITGLSHVLDWFHEPASVVKLGQPFLLLLTWSIIPMYLFQVLKQFCEAQHHAWPPLLILIGGMFLNIALNWLFIYGHFGVPAMGLLGAGWATLLTRGAMLVAVAVYVAREFFPDTLARQWFAQRLPDFTGYGELLRLGLPAGFQTILEAGAFSTAAIMMGWISEAALAAHQVAISVASMTFMVPLGLSMSVAIRVSHAMGRGLPTQARQAIHGALLLAVGFMATSALLLFVFARPLAALFLADASVVGLAAQVLIIAGLFQIFDGIQVVSFGALRGLHDVKIPTLFNLFGYWVLGLPISWVIAFHFHVGATGVWWGLLVGLAFVATCLVVRLEILLRRQR